jgi:hypothetical protein
VVGIKIHGEEAVTTVVTGEERLFKFFLDAKRQDNHKRKRMLDVSGWMGKRNNYFGIYK